MNGQRRDLRLATVRELTAQVRIPTDRAEVFDADVVDELLRRAELGERLAAQDRAESLRRISPSEGYSADDF